MGLTFSALGPFGPWPSTNETRWPRVRSSNRTLSTCAPQKLDARAVGRTGARAGPAGLGAGRSRGDRPPSQRGRCLRKTLRAARSRRSRDPLYTAHFRSILQAAGVQALRLPAYCPNLNAYAERFVNSIKHECLRHIIPSASVICAASCANSWSATTPSATTSASPTSSPSPPASHSTTWAASNDDKDSGACSC